MPWRHTTNKIIFDNWQAQGHQFRLLRGVYDNIFQIHRKPAPPGGGNRFSGKLAFTIPRGNHTEIFADDLLA